MLSLLSDNARLGGLLEIFNVQESQSLSELEGPKYSFALVIPEAKKGQGTYPGFRVGKW